MLPHINHVFLIIENNIADRHKQAYNTSFFGKNGILFKKFFQSAGSSDFFFKIFPYCNFF